MTGRPVRISRLTRFTRSTRDCIFLNFGMATSIRIIIRQKMHTTASTMIQPMPVLVPTTLMMPPMPMMGANSTIRSSMTTTICTCWMSLVLRVIRDAVENWSISVWEKCSTLSNTCRRRSRPT